MKRSWPILLLLVAVIVPTVSMLWFMLAAIDNERVAVQQRLIGAYRAQLIGVKGQLAAHLQQSAVDLDRRIAGTSCATLFATLVRAGDADGVICDDPGAPYPGSSTAPVSTSGVAAPWNEAARLERKGEFDEAAKAFANIAGGDGDLHVVARALQAQARCLSKASRPDAAVRVVREQLMQPRYRAAADARGRLIVPNVQLLALQLIDDPEQEAFTAVATALRDRLDDYGDPAMPGPQRRFLMSELGRLVPDMPAFDTHAAEELAAGFLNSETPTAAASSLTRSGPDGIWQLVSPSAKVITLHTDTALRERLMRTITETDLSAEATAELLLPGADPGAAKVLVSFAPDEALPGWRLALHLDDQALVDAATGRQITVYLWTGVLVIVLMVSATAWIAGAIGRQLRLTQLKNDLLATVSHELKTPLASMRLLVETLLDGQHDEPKRVREYLQLILNENHRLSRLVENFLSFSRMERNKHNFEQADITVCEVTEAAVAAVGDRFNEEDCRFDVEIASDLPRIHADPDALVTAILNLLDNAYKYSARPRQIVLRAYADGGEVCFAVRDNGVGLSARARSRIFERFYQVDQSLSRSGGGCGLGLSIVRFIVGAHGGSVDVDSRPGKGSTFTIRIPTAGETGDADARQEALV